MAPATAKRSRLSLRWLLWPYRVTGRAHADLPRHLPIILAVLSLSAPLLARDAPPARPLEGIDGCRLEPDEWTDGDSFRVRLPDGCLETFRLYFVDTTESRSRGQRSDDQAAYFDMTRAEAVQLGKEAKAFTAAKLAQPFTIQTRWRAVFGPARYYAFVYTASGDDLAQLRAWQWGNCPALRARPAGQFCFVDARFHAGQCRSR